MTNYMLIDGKIVAEPDIIKWAQWFETAQRVVARDEVGDVLVSTVFLGIDHGFTRQGPPILWETMIFGGPHDQYQDRYCTQEEALAGHATALAIAKGEANED